ncbi:MAG: hypothetical protein ACLFQX_09665 [Candidatus Kapaibacterium sp.]
MNDKTNICKPQSGGFSRRKFFAVAAIGSAALIAPSACDILNTEDKGDDTIKKIIQNVISGDHALSYITVVYTIGLKNWEHGETQLTAYGSGQATVQNIDNSKYVSYSGTIASSEFMQLMQKMNDGEFWNINSSQKGLPDEAPVSVTISDSDSKQSHTVSMFHSEAMSNSAFRPIVEKLDLWVNQISNGKLF